MKTEENYDALKVERVIDDAYRMAEGLEVEDLVVDEIEVFEKMPYSVNRSGEYTEKQLENAVRALNQLENIYRDVEASTIEVARIEEMLTEHAHRPARDHGKMITPKLE